MNWAVLSRPFFKVRKLDKRLFSTKRKFPLPSDHADRLPIFDYSVSNPNYNRVYVWGNVTTGALGVPYKTKKTLRPFEAVGFPYRLNFAEHHRVAVVGCGFGFTVFAVNSPTPQLYGTGLNTDSQIGYHEVSKGKPLDVIYFLQPINLPLEDKGLKIHKICGGRAHLSVLTNRGLFTLGNNSYGQCGREIVENENYTGSKYMHHIAKINDLEISNIACGQDHTIAVTQDGSVYSCGMGADGQTGLGHFNSTYNFTRLHGDIALEKIVKVATKSDFNLALNDRGQVFGWGNIEYGQMMTKNDLQQVSVPRVLNLPGLGKIVDIATGGTFCVVVNDKGEVYVWGYGLIGVGPKVQNSKVPLQIPSTLFGRNELQPDSKVERVSCGINHICAVTNRGDLYTWGRNKDRCLGFGDDQDRFFPLRVSLSGLVQQVDAGFDHTVAICKPFI